MRLGTDTGSLVNHVAATSPAPEPKVGMGATVLCWTDRKAGTIVKVERNLFVVQEDRATRTDGNGISESQDYAYAPDPDGRLFTFRRVTSGRRKGQWGQRGDYGVLIGHRDHYHDFSF